MDDTKQMMREFWNLRPCGSSTSAEGLGTKEFFEDVEAFRYSVEPCIVNYAQFNQTRGKRVLEIGVGLGTDSLQFLRNGAHFTGIDISDSSLQFTQQRFRLYGCHGSLCQADAESLPFASNIFDIVYSWGVLLCVPNIDCSIGEVHRVLRKGGKGIVMLYHQNSINYWISIMLIRRCAYRLMKSRVGFSLVDAVSKLDKRLRAKLDRIGSLAAFRTLLNKKDTLTKQEILNMSTDGPGLPYTSVFTRRQARALFSRFSDVRISTSCLYEQNLPFGRFIPETIKAWLEKKWGWFLVIEAIK